MSERKVLNKYYPVDFDASLIPRAKKPKNEQYKVRMMCPFSVRCLSCGEYIGAGKKFNCRKETVIGEEYLGIKIFRFYFRCTRCSREITIKTDPENSDYICEFGATRNYESVLNEGAEKEALKKKKKEEEEGDAMKQLENRTMDNKMEMDILDGLDEIRSLNAQSFKVDPMSILGILQEQKNEVLDDEATVLLKLSETQKLKSKVSLIGITDEDGSQITDMTEAELSPKSITKNTKFAKPLPIKKKESKIGKFGAKPQSIQINSENNSPVTAPNSESDLSNITESNSDDIECEGFNFGY